MYDYGVVIGRFQPFHNMHLELVQRALAECSKVIIVIGSCNAARTVKDPWSGPNREQMIAETLGDDEDRVQYVYARDYLYNNTLWLTAVQEQISSIIDDEETPNGIALFGHKKDDSSFYLRYFPQWTFVDVGRLGDVDATHVRNLYFHQDLIGCKHLVPAPVYSYLKDWSETQEFKNLHADFHYYLKYKLDSKFVGLPFNPTFVTVDTVVTCSGHVLVIKRGCNPGKGLFALPGGFLDGREMIEDAAIRELKEETRIKTSEADLKDMIVGSRVFDHPNRSLRGRTITHAFHVDISKRFSKLPPVKGGDDASHAFWMPLIDVFSNEDKFFDDHAHIIRHFALKL